MVKNLKNIKWEPVALEGFPASLSENFQGFIGLEECTDYGFEKDGKKSKKKKQEKKPKRKATPITEVPAKKVKLANGFIVETCEKVKPTLSEEDKTKKANNKNKQNKPKEKKEEIAQSTPKTKKNKPKLGENTVETSLQLSVEEMQAWSAMQIPDEILRALAEQGFKAPSKIQELTLPSAMLGRRDILGAAQTGSGKTLAFGIPILTGIMKLKENQAAGVDVYETPYKKSSVKKKTVQEKRNKNKFHKKPSNTKEKNKSKTTESSEEGYSSGDSDDNDEKSDNRNDEMPADENDSQDGSDEEFLEEYDVPLKEKDSSVDEGNDSDDTEANCVRLSDMLDSDDVDDSSDEENDYIDDNRDDKDDVEDTDSQNECEEEENVDGDNEGIGCVKVVDHLEMPGHVVTKTGKPLYALILTPTRELAMQVSRHLISAAKYTGIRIATVVGGMAAVKQERVLSKGPEVVVATPGRLWELLRQGQTHLEQVDNIKFLAIDETDRMLERNHFEELHPLLERINTDETKRGQRQNFVFSATLTMVHDLPQHMKGKKVTKRGKIINRKIKKMTPEQKIKKLISMIGMTDPKVVDITTQNLGAAETLTECRISCSLEQKDYYLFYILKRHPGRTIVFCNSIGSVKRLAQLFGLLKCNPLPLHASMPQRQRLKNLERFRDDPQGVLVATDVAARGLDIPDVDHVLHYQVPRTAENYVHRSGRTARANKEGLTILMMEPGEAFLYTKLCRTLNKTSEIPSFPIPAHILNAMKAIVSLARDVDKLQLSHRRVAQEQGWLDKAAREMDMLIDEDFLPTKYRETSTAKALQAKKKHLDNLLCKPIFPKGFSYKYPTLNDPDILGVKSEQNALQVMKNALESGELKREKRKSKNAPLLKLVKKLKQ